MLSVGVVMVCPYVCVFSCAASLPHERQPPYIELRGGHLRDLRVDFLEAWRSIQRTCSEPCDPVGLALAGADPDLREAYRELGIGDYVNPSRGLAAAARD
jgi:hypothetical protein